MDYISELRRDTRPLRDELMAHPVYRMVNSLENLRVFMQHHIFAVWDFMSLLKRLQQLQTGIDVPWLPKPNRTATRFINEIVLGEESDEDDRGGYISHFELYREAMAECDASTYKIDRLTESMASGLNVDEALRECAADPSIVDFVRTTWCFVSSAKPHCLAASFTFGREDVIPDMFRRCMAVLAPELALQRTKYYLARHVELDETRHAPMSIRVMHELCGTDKNRWIESTDAVLTALRARIVLWDGVVSAFKDSPVLSRVGSAEVVVPRTESR